LGLFRAAGTDYPAWTLAKYTQLPLGLPQRVRDLGAELTAGANTLYEKAKAIEGYLRTIPYTTKVEPPPFNADGVDHFFFTLGKGYSEYYSSAMAVLLRLVNVPARLATGYTAGDKVPDQQVYIVTDSHVHGWVEVFFPRYGWISFELTSGKALPPLYSPESEEVADESTVGAVSGPELGDCFPTFENCAQIIDPPPASAAQEDSTLWSGTFRRILPWLLSALGAVALLAGGAWWFWRRYMTPSEDPRVAYRCLSLLGALSSNGPAANQTPCQYRDRLQQVLPHYC
jgi:transglutaminase-like putative cysteine protease